MLAAGVPAAGAMPAARAVPLETATSETNTRAGIVLITAPSYSNKPARQRVILSPTNDIAPRRAFRSHFPSASCNFTPVYLVSIHRLASRKVWAGIFE